MVNGFEGEDGFFVFLERFLEIIKFVVSYVFGLLKVIEIGF